MRLRNKKTGVVGEVGYISTPTGDILVSNIHDQEEWYHYKSLAELNSEWEDAPEEPKDFWYIDDFMIMCGTEGEFTTPDLASFTKKDIEKLKAIGNYFETKEEAEKAMEKLKAWKRLKDKGISFETKVIERKWYLEPKADLQQRTFDDAHDVFKDLMIVFRGEE